MKINVKSRTVFGRSLRDIVRSFGPALLIAGVAIALIYKYVDPAPPRHFVISSGSGEGDYQEYAKQYRDILKEDGIDLEIRPSSGAMENLQRLKDEKSSDVEAGFVQDGLGSSEEALNLSSLGSLGYEPLWVFYRGNEMTRFSHLQGKRLAVGPEGGGTRTLALRVLKASGVDEKNTRFFDFAWDAAAEALREGKVDAAVFLGTPEEPLIRELILDKRLRLMNVDQADAIARQIPFLHHLVLPHGAVDLKNNIPSQDVNLVSPTSTLLVRDSLHPALIYLLLKAATQVHNEPGIFERKDEFPIGKDYQFPLADEAKQYYKSGTPFWQRYLPFWLATLVERFILFAIPAIALIFPILKLVPKFFDWRVRSRIYQRYGELKYLETQIKPETHHEKYAEYLAQLDVIESRIDHMKFPLVYSELVYGLRQNIDFVRGRIRRALEKK